MTGNVLPPYRLFDLLVLLPVLIDIDRPCRWKQSLQ